MMRSNTNISNLRRAWSGDKRSGCYIGPMEAWANTAGNLSPGAASRRLRLGVIILAIGLIGAVIMTSAAVHPAYRALLFIPFFLAANGFYQGRHRP